jgi:hypothetical protein
MQISMSHEGELVFKFCLMWKQTELANPPPPPRVTEQHPRPPLSSTVLGFRIAAT